MKRFCLALMAVLGLGVSVANAATAPSAQAQHSSAAHTQNHKPNYYNWQRGDGG